MTTATRRARWKAAVGAALLALGAAALPGCISEPPVEGLPPMCEEHGDCDQASGEMCDEGVCWGDPPDQARFAAVLVPPAERADLPLTVLPLLSIASDGSIGGLDFPQAVQVRGRVILACPATDSPSYSCGTGASVGAQILVERSPEFPGGPTYSRAVVATEGAEPGQDAFSFRLPLDPDAEYRITIQPDDSVGGEDIAPGEIAPPRQIMLRADRSRRVDWVIGEPSELKIIRGCVQNVVGEGAPYAGMRVVAFGRWTQLSPLERASSRSVTGKDGCFELSVPHKMLDQFDISVQPASGAILPSFYLAGEFVRDPAEGEQVVHTIDPPLVMPIAPAPSTFRLPVEAPATGGGPEPVVGADVRLTTRFEVPSLNEARSVEITFSAQVVTTAASEEGPGEAVVELYPGDEKNRTYLVSVVPPAGSQFQSAFEREIAVGIGGPDAVLEALTLERRTAVTGRAAHPNGDWVVDAPIVARPSTAFRQLLGQEALEQTVAELPFPTATTDQDGLFILWLDRVLVGETASYDIDVTPPIYSGAPSWSFEDVGIPAQGELLELGKLTLPEASFARATVQDRRGRPVPGAELHLYQLPPDDYCASQVGLSPAECEPQAKLRGVWRSDEEGTVRVILPDP
jgi:hypothetical protein